MKKYILRYLLFWLPAAAISYFYNNTSGLSQVLQWVFASVMAVAWAVNTGMAAYLYPRTTLSLVFAYSGVSAFLILALYSAPYKSYYILQPLAGMFGYVPLDIYVMALLDFNIPHEWYVTIFLVTLCLIGYLIGLICRRLRPNPYRPVIVKK